MNCHSTKRSIPNLKAACFIVVGAVLAAIPAARGATIVNDSWADGGRTNGADPLDTGWWASTSTSAIEVSVGSLGLVTGASAGRGIHGIFSGQQLLNVGDTLTATYTFTTPATVGSAKDAGLRIGLFDTQGNSALEADLTASSGSPNALYNPLLGYMVDYDVNSTPSNIQFRERTNPASGQLMATTADFTNLGSAGGSTYAFLPNTSYTGVYSITKSVTGLSLTSSLSQGSILLSSHTSTDSTPSTSTFHMLAFHVNSAVFGSSGTPGAADNGIDFSNIKIEFNPVPEPSALLLCTMFATLVGAQATARRRRARHLG